MRVLLDTHAIVWWQADGQRLSARATREIARAEGILVSPISCWEIATLVARDRIALDRDVYSWTRDLLDQDRVQLAALTPQAAVGAALLGQQGFHGDPADRFLYATARDLVVPLVTKDATIRDYARDARDIRTIW